MNFAIKQREIEIESTFAPRLWSVVHDVPVLYEALLDRLAPFGLSIADLRPEAGSGSVGSAGVAFRLFGSQVNVQIRLDSFRFRTSSLDASVVSFADGVADALRQAMRDELHFKPMPSLTPAMD